MAGFAAEIAVLPRPSPGRPDPSGSSASGTAAPRRCGRRSPFPARPRDGAKGDAGVARVHGLPGCRSRRSASRASLGWARGREQLGLLAAELARRSGRARARGRRGDLGRGRGGEAEPARVRAGARRAGSASEAVHVGDKVDNDRGRRGGRRAGRAPSREGDPPRGRGGGRIASGAEAYSEPRAAASPGPAAASPAGRPELPEGAAPRWPAWYAGVGFLVALIATLVVVGILAAALGVTSDDEDPVFTASATFLQSLIFIGTAVMFASSPARRARSTSGCARRASGRPWAGPPWRSRSSTWGSPPTPRSSSRTRSRASPRTGANESTLA